MWRNWQTRCVQVAVSLRSCEFESRHRHTEVCDFGFFISYTTSFQTVDKLGAGIIPAPFFPLKLNCIQKFLRNLRFCPFSNPFLPRNLASFFRFIHAKVSPAFISIRAFPMYCVYRNPWCSFAVPKILSIVSFRF